MKRWVIIALIVGGILAVVSTIIAVVTIEVIAKKHKSSSSASAAGDAGDASGNDATKNQSGIIIINPVIIKNGVNIETFSSNFSTFLNLDSSTDETSLSDLLNININDSSLFSNRVLIKNDGNNEFEVVKPLFYLLKQPIKGSSLKFQLFVKMIIHSYLPISASTSANRDEEDSSSKIQFIFYKFKNVDPPVITDANVFEDDTILKLPSSPFCLNKTFTMGDKENFNLDLSSGDYLGIHLHVPGMKALNFTLRSFSLSYSSIKTNKVDIDFDNGSTNDDAPA